MAPTTGASGMYTFTKYCGFDTIGATIAEAFVPSFNDCIDMCSNFNYRTGQEGATCFAVSFLVDGRRPGNCFAKGDDATLLASPDVASALIKQNATT